MTKRVTLTVESDSGAKYLYDDVTGAILPWTDVREEVLKANLNGGIDAERERLVSRFGDRDVASADRFVKHWIGTYKAFERRWSDEDWVAPPPPDDLEKLIRSRAMGLLLIVTEDCNLRCSYCALSEVYPMNRVRTNRRMTVDIAKRAIDWYADFVSEQRVKNPKKRYGLSFYGGDPLMNFPVVKASLEHARANYPGLFGPVMTTNGTLLTPKVVETLVEHEVFVLISLDGPAEDHDRQRQDALGRPTHDRILNNLRWVRENHPDYWLRKLRSVAVYDWKTDIERCVEYFEGNPDVPLTIFVNPVASVNTDYYAKFNKDDAKTFVERAERLTQQYMDAKVHGAATNGYLKAIVGDSIGRFILRQREHDVRPSFLPFTSTCLPGEKIAVHVDGKIDMCERVNGHNPIGHLDQGGVDFQVMHDLLDEYQREVMKTCPSCPVTKHCSTCYVQTEEDKGYAKRPKHCAGTVIDVRSRLGKYLSILEKNRHVNFQLNTDTLSLEERFMAL